MSQYQEQGHRSAEMLIPRSVDDIINLRRDEATLRILTDDEIAALPSYPGLPPMLNVGVDMCRMRPVAEPEIVEKFRRLLLG